MAAGKLREWRGVKQVAGPSGVAITTRLRTRAVDEAVLDAVADQLGRLRRADLVAVCCPEPLAPGLDTDGQRRVRRQLLNTRKAALTAQSSARWANAIIGANDKQYRLARDAQYRHMVGLRAAITTNLARPAGQEHRYRAGQPSPRQRPTTANHPSNGLSIFCVGITSKVSHHRCWCLLCCCRSLRGVEPQNVAGRYVVYVRLSSAISISGGGWDRLRLRPRKAILDATPELST